MAARGGRRSSGRRIPHIHPGGPSSTLTPGCTKVLNGPAETSFPLGKSPRSPAAVYHQCDAARVWRVTAEERRSRRRLTSSHKCWSKEPEPEFFWQLGPSTHDVGWTLDKTRANVLLSCKHLTSCSTSVDPVRFQNKSLCEGTNHKPPLNQNIGC